MTQDLKNKIEKLISQPEQDVRAWIAKLKQLLYEADMEGRPIKEPKNIKELFSENLSRLNGTNQKSHLIKSGFTDLDEEFGGFALGEYVVVGGRPSMGKTQVLVNMALHISKTRPVLYFTFDLTEFLLTARFISTLTGIPIENILQQKLTKDEEKAISKVEDEIGQRQLYINDSYHNSVTALKALCQKQIEENGIQVIIIDYLQMMSSRRHHNNRVFEISYISRELKNLAKDLNVSVIVASQLSQAVEARGGYYPILSDLRDSGTIEEDADKVILLFRPEYYSITEDHNGHNLTGVMELIIAKNKSGPLGSLKLLGDAHGTKYRDFDGYKSGFEFSRNRLKELTMTNPKIKNLIEKLDLEEEEEEDE